MGVYFYDTVIENVILDRVLHHAQIVSVVRNAYRLKEHFTFEDKMKYENEIYRQAVKTLIIVQDTLNYNIPFIQNDLYEKYNEVLGLCRVQIGIFEDLRGGQGKEESLLREDYKITREINMKFKELNEEIRKYIATLYILD